jgi:hypothetical protein
VRINIINHATQKDFPSFAYPVRLYLFQPLQMAMRGNGFVAIFKFKNGTIIIIIIVFITKALANPEIDQKLKE